MKRNDTLIAQYTEYVEHLKKEVTDESNIFVSNDTLNFAQELLAKLKTGNITEKELDVVHFELATFAVRTKKEAEDTKASKYLQSVLESGTPEEKKALEDLLSISGEGRIS